MNNGTVKNLIQWLNYRLEVVRPQLLELHLYGGEPLLNPAALWPVLDGVRAASERLGIKFGSYITTNGSLLTPSISKKLASKGINTALISIDGPPDVHNQRRPMRDGRGTFDKIISNILHSTPELNICIRINLDKQNSCCIPDLLKFMAQHGLQERVLIDLEVVSPVFSPNPHVQEFLFRNEEDLIEIEHLWELCAEFGFKILGAMPIEGACEHKSVNTYTVDANGDLYECPGFVGLTKFKIGNVDDYQACRSVRSGLVNRPWHQCADCPYLPICQGGCRMCNFVQKGELASPYCKRNFFERSYPGFLRAKYSNYLPKLRNSN